MEVLKSHRKNLLLNILACSACLALPGFAAVLADCDIESGSPVAAVTVGDDMTASSLTFSATAVNGTADFRGTQIAYLTDTGSYTTTPTSADIRASWSIAADSGFQITLDATNSVSGGFRVYQQFTGTGTVYGKLFVASDSGITNILAESSIASSASTSAAGPVVYATVDSPLVSATTLYFGLALSSIEEGGANAQARFDDFTVRGTVTAIPEPASAALIGLAGICLLLRRHRSRSRSHFS